MTQVYNRDEAEFIAIPTTQPDYYIMIELTRNTSDACRDAVNGNTDPDSTEEKDPSFVVAGTLTTTLFDGDCCLWDVMTCKGHPFYLAFGQDYFCPDKYDHESFEQLRDVKHNLSDFADIKVNGQSVSFEMESIPELAFQPHIWEEFDEQQLDWLREIGQVTKHMSVEIPLEMMLRKEIPEEAYEMDMALARAKSAA